MADVKMAKKFLRAKVAELLKSIPEAEIKRQTEVVEKEIFSSDWFKNSQRVSVFVSTSGEIITDGIIRRCLDDGKQVFIPRFRLLP